VPNYLRLFAHRPAVYAAWRGLLGSITTNIDARRYELATVAAARKKRSTYCTLAHSAVLVLERRTGRAIRADG
jgi:AhpD family alkylhydroperoxidase